MANDNANKILSLTEKLLEGLEAALGPNQTYTEGLRRQDVMQAVLMSVYHTFRVQCTPDESECTMTEDLTRMLEAIHASFAHQQTVESVADLLEQAVRDIMAEEHAKYWHEHRN